VLEQLCDGKEEGRRLCAAKGLSDIEQIDDFGEEDATFAWAYGRFLGVETLSWSRRVIFSKNETHIEDPGFLQDGCLVLKEKADCRDSRVKAQQGRARRDVHSPPASSSFFCMGT
jgi:hypothetical protein